MGEKRKKLLAGFCALMLPATSSFCAFQFSNVGGEFGVAADANFRRGFSC